MKSPRLLESASVVSSLTLISRIMGMVRTMIAASIFGSTLAMDAFVIAFTVPNLFRRLFGEGALSSAFVPVYTRTLEQDGKAKAQVLFNSLLTRVGLILLGLTLLGIGGCYLLDWTIHHSPSLAQALKGDYEKVILTSALLKILFPYLFLVCVLALLSALLNSLGHFASPSLAPIVLNVFWIGGLVWLAPVFGARPDQMIIGVAVAVLIGGVAQVATQIPAMRSRGIGFRPRLVDAPPEISEIRRLMVPMIFGAAVMQLNILIDRAIAVGLVAGDGAVSALYYADRLIQFPMSLTGIAVAVAAFPILSRHVARGEMKEAAGKVAASVKGILAVTLPATIGLAILSKPIIELIYERGVFGAGDSVRTARVLLLYSLGLWAFSGQHVLVRAFYSMRMQSVPVRVATGMVALNLVLNLSLVGTLQESGLALATAITGTIQFCLLLFLLRRRLPELRGLGLLSSFYRSLSISIVMGVAVWITFSYVSPAGSSTSARALRVVIPMLVGVGIYAAASALLRTPEFLTVATAIRRRIKGR